MVYVYGSQGIRMSLIDVSSHGEQAALQPGGGIEQPRG